jgi:PAS domain S-box-containing protein
MSARVVLLVEDTPRTRTKLRLALEAQGYAVLEPGNGRSAPVPEASRPSELVVVFPKPSAPRRLLEVALAPAVADCRPAPEPQESYRLLFDRSPLPMLVLDEETLAFLAVNDAAVRQYGWSRDELLGMKLGDICTPDEVVRLRESVVPARADASAQGAEARCFGRHQRQDGGLMDVECHLSAVQFRGRGAVLTVAIDLAESKAHEARVARSEKMESVGRLAGAVADDFSTVLGVVSGFAELLRKRLPDNPVLRRYTDDILKAVNRGAALTRQLQAFGRRQPRRLRLVDLNDVVAEREPLLRRLAGEEVHVVTILDRDVAPVRADVGQLERILMNLVSNARDAMPRGGRLVVETGSADLTEEGADSAAGVRPGRYATLAVSDSGEGMSADVQSHLFEPFFTTKDPGKGAGLGLATIHGVVAQNGGHVLVHSEAGLGSTFKVYLPLAEETATPPMRAADEPPPAGSETVLVLEEEPGLRRILQECLESGGYTVLPAGDGDAAIGVSARHDASIHLLLTDVVLPGAEGRTLAEKLRARRPEMSVLYMSGDSREATGLRAGTGGDPAVLEKPFTASGLLRAVRTALDRNARAE